MPTDGGGVKRGRGRPKKDGFYPGGGHNTGSRLDPTGDLFLKTE